MARDASSLAETVWMECEAVIKRFEVAWRGANRPDLEAYLTAVGPQSSLLLVELVHVDLEFRLRAGEPARVEEYLARFPALTGDDELVLDLIATEFALRTRHRPPVWPEEYYLRFPEYLRRLAPLLSARGRGALPPTGPASPGPAVGPPSIPGYEVLGELGRGGMGVVYKARDPALNRAVAIKTLGSIPGVASCARFAREAESIARLDHPHIVPVYEVGEWDAGDGDQPVPFFVMKWYPGGSLDAAPAGPGTDPAAHARVVETVARAVHHAHQRGVLHRDLKPSNILLDEHGEPHVADFGLAGRFEPAAALAEDDPAPTDAPATRAGDEFTLTAGLIGTPAYMAPEQARSPKQVTTAADVFGLGAILYHRLTGLPPFSGKTPLAALDRRASGPPPRLSAVNPAVPRDLEAVCLKCLAHDPADRYPSAEAVAEDLARWRSGLPVLARPAAAWERAWRLVRRHPVLAAMSASTVAALVVAVITLAVGNARIRAQERETLAALAAVSEAKTGYADALHREQRQLYVVRAASAGRLFTANQLPHVWRLLDDCPADFRGWEWRYLDSLRRAGPATFRGHEAWVASAAFLPDGRLATADNDGVVRVWSADGSVVWSRRVAKTAGSRLVVHPTRDWIAAADLRGITVVTAGTGDTVRELPGANWAAFSQDGAFLATGDGPAVRLWGLPDWEPRGHLRGHEQVVFAGAFSPDGARLVTSSSDLTLRIWDPATGEPVGPPWKRPVLVPRLAFTPDGRAILEAWRGSVMLSDPATGDIRGRVQHPAGNRVYMASSPDGRRVAFNGENGEVVVWDLARGRVEQVFRGHFGQVSALAFSPDGARLASGGADTAVRVWDVNRQIGVRTLAEVGEEIGSLALAPDGTRVAIGPRILGPPGRDLVRVFDTDSGRELWRVRANGDVAFHPDSRRLAAGRHRGEIVVWDTDSGKEVWARTTVGLTDRNVLYYPDGRRVAFSPNGKRLATWNVRGGGVQLWGAADGSGPEVIDTGDEFVYGLAFSADSGRLAVAGSRSVGVWDLPSRTRFNWTHPTRGGALAVAFSPTGIGLATAETDHVVRLRDECDGRVLLSFAGAPTRVTALAFNPTGTRMVTAGSDHSVRVWDTETGQELLALPGAGGPVAGVAWDRAGERVFALDDAIRVWGPGRN